MSGSSTRFRKGQSGNPKGRPRKPVPAPSAFDIIIDRTLTVMQNGIERELSVDEALQQRTWQDAIGGNRTARRDVLRMIARREHWIAANTKPPKAPPVEVMIEQDADNANAALLLLGIASRDPRTDPSSDPYERLLLEPWAVEAALRRRRQKALDDRDLGEIRRCTRDPETIQWP